MRCFFSWELRLASGGTVRSRLAGGKTANFFYIGCTCGDCRGVWWSTCSFRGEYYGDFICVRMTNVRQQTQTYTFYLQIGVIDTVVHDTPFVVGLLEQSDHRPGRHIRVQSSGPNLFRVHIRIFSTRSHPVPCFRSYSIAPHRSSKHLLARFSWSSQDLPRRARQRVQSCPNHLATYVHPCVTFNSCPPRIARQAARNRTALANDIRPRGYTSIERHQTKTHATNHHTACICTLNTTCCTPSAWFQTFNIQSGARQGRCGWRGTNTDREA